MDQGEVSHELVAVHQLPVVDVDKSVKTALLSESGVKKYKVLNKKIKHASIFFYFVAFPIGASVLTVATKYARILSLFKFSSQVPLLIAVTAGLRIDILRCLAVTYDFWFFSVLDALACVMFAINFSDMRIFMAPVYWYGIQLCVCADAKIRDPRVGSASALASIYHIFLLVVFGLQLTPGRLGRPARSNSMEPDTLRVQHEAPSGAVLSGACRHAPALVPAGALEVVREWRGRSDHGSMRRGVFRKPDSSSPAAGEQCATDKPATQARIFSSGAAGRTLALSAAGWLRSRPA